MNLGIITYNFPHLKTEQVLLRLVEMDCQSIQLFALPFKPRKPRKPIIVHRPFQEAGAHPEEMARKFGLRYQTIDQDHDIPGGLDYYLILGAGILSEEFIRGKKTINCHPGVIPASRGLDSFKWSIHDQKPLGISLHFIDEKVDAGEIISIKPTPVFSNDTIESLARRHYELEIDMTARFQEFFEKPVNPFEDIAVGEPHMRMNQETEKVTLAKFKGYLEKFSFKE
ncbi:MAG: hypothetical protein G3M70_09925 [Candidatus Nitronauta litoralis]|uniref:phosphoribosylglycinamide formyltransferase 1 n=1 Tax=Candidatus Nitronauta litoralis TaxID=2705533 RepID=A0A7T0BWD6_9BACT|nr:MAG: hypothetical protein G3M70_09925 [Candidatus Nitronauta litoralis]